MKVAKRLSGRTAVLLVVALIALSWGLIDVDLEAVACGETSTSAGDTTLHHQDTLTQDSGSGWWVNLYAPPVTAGVSVAALAALGALVWGAKFKVPYYRRVLRNAYRQALVDELLGGNARDAPALEREADTRARSVFETRRVRQLFEVPGRTGILAEWLEIRVALADSGGSPGAPGLVLKPVARESFYQRLEEVCKRRRSLVEHAEWIHTNMGPANDDPRFAKGASARKWSSQIDRFIEEPENCEYFEQVMRELPPHLKASRDGADWENSEFRVVAATLSATRGPRGEAIVSVCWPENPRVAYTKAQRKAIEADGRWPAHEDMRAFVNREASDMAPSLARFSAGGSLTILRVLDENAAGQNYIDYVVVGQKDEGAPSDSGKYVPSSGLAERQEDWDDPRLIIANECVEEIRVRSRECCAKPPWFVPTFGRGNGSQGLNDRVEIAWSTHCRRLEDYQRHMFWKNEIPERRAEWSSGAEVVHCPAEIISLGDDLLLINDKELGEPHLIVMDPTYGAVDLMAAVRMKIDRPLSGLRVIDGEAVRKRRKDGDKMKLLWRNVYVLTAQQLSSFFEGNMVEGVLFFGRGADGRWLDGVGTEIAAGSQERMNEPLRKAGRALLDRIDNGQIEWWGPR
jgi:hypothetical protein